MTLSAHHVSEPCPRAGEWKIWLTSGECLRSQSTCEPPGTFHHHPVGWHASLWPDTSPQVCRTQDTNSSPLPAWPQRLLQTSHCYALNTPLREEPEQLVAHRSHTETWQHPSQVFLLQGEAKANPQLQPSGSSCVQTQPRHWGTRVFHR